MKNHKTSYIKLNSNKLPFKKNYYDYEVSIVDKLFPILITISFVYFFIYFIVEILAVYDHSLYIEKK